MPRKWTKEQREAQAERCRHHKPWTKSTGPKTATGKARSNCNAYKHGCYTDRYQNLKQMFFHARQMRQCADRHFARIFAKDAPLYYHIFFGTK